MKTWLKRFWWNRGPEIVGFSLMFTMTVGAFALVYALDSAACSAKWGGEAEYSLLTGCMLDGIPTDNIRVLK